VKDSLKPGITKTARITIDEARTIDFMGDEGRVYATPELVRDIEHTSRDLLLEHLEPGEDSVGIRVEIDHTAATLLGMWVEITATVTAVEGRRVILEVKGRDPVDDIVRGQHMRFIVDVATSVERLKQKAEKARQISSEQ
jgi:fluoroacetyl-CoA thioesterase